MIAVAAVLAAAAVGLAVGPGPHRQLRRLQPPEGATRGGRPSPLWLLAGLPLALGLGLPTFGWLLAAAIATGTVAWVVRQARARSRVREHRVQTARAASTLALLLRAGQIPTVALPQVAEDFDFLAPVETALRVGGSATDALQELASQPGREGLGHLAAAWQVSLETGAPMAQVVSQVSDQLREQQQLADVVSVELSSARASSRIMAGLPFVAIALGIAVGADPLGFLFGSLLGEILFVSGVALTAAGVIWTERIAARAGAA